MISTEKSPFDRAGFAAAFAECAAAERAGAPGKVSDLMRRAAPAARLDAMQYADRGDKIALRLSRSVDAIVSAIHENAPDVGVAFAICAVGGYGRRELAPFSDVDLLFLHEPADDETVRRVLDFMLYPLWDSGMKVGYAVHTPKSAVAFAKADMVARTAYLDARFITGAQDLFDAFTEGYHRLRRRTGAQFVAAKLKEQGERQALAGETRYLVEPDIKEGKGGLRDVQTIRWIYDYIYDGRIGDHGRIDEILGPAAVRDLIKAERFLWSVRAHLHDLRGRADEKLSFDIQPRVAERLGYADRRDMTATERLMRHYFVTAVDVGRLTRILCARLEEESAKRLPRLPARLPAALQTDEAPGTPNLRLTNGRLDFARPDDAAADPRDFFRLFRAFSKNTKIDFHPDALAIVSENTPLVTSAVRKDPVVRALFIGILESTADPVRVLRIMTETGLLGKYIPSFGQIVGRIHYGLYRRFTLDEEVLLTIGVLRDIRLGKLAKEHPVSTRIVKKAGSGFSLALALLLHESNWIVKGKSARECEKLVRRVARRLGLADTEASLVAWVAAHHLLLVRTAERRNLTDARTISQFVKVVQTQERLDWMVVLTTCHLRIVSHRSWDAVIRRQLIELYEAASAWFDGGEAALQRRLDQRANRTRAQARRRLTEWTEDDKEAFLARLSDEMIRCVDPDIVIRFAYLARAAERDAADAAATVTPRDGDLECIVYAEDRAGLLADIAGAVAHIGLSVRSVQALTTDDGRALDIFAVQSADGSPVDDPALVRRLHDAVLKAARAEPAATPNLKRRIGDRRPIFAVEPAVRIDREAAHDAVVVEAEGLDRPGLLYELASGLAELGVSIASAHVSTYGERAVDAFYITYAAGGKITDLKTLRAVERRLLAILASGPTP